MKSLTSAALSQRGNEAQVKQVRELNGLTLEKEKGEEKQRRKEGGANEGDEVQV